MQTIPSLSKRPGFWEVGLNEETGRAAGFFYTTEPFQALRVVIWWVFESGSCSSLVYNFQSRNVVPRRETQIMELGIIVIGPSRN